MPKVDRKPRLLDLFCGGGGCSMGYHRAGFDVIGVDNRRQPNYPFTFHRADALEFLEKNGKDYDVIHASPPCQCYSVTKNLHNAEHPDLVRPTRHLLLSVGRPYLMENVPQAPLMSPVMLCGGMFGLKVWRHRMFESALELIAPRHKRHNGSTGSSGSYSSNRTNRNGYICVAGHNYDPVAGARAMGIGWMKRSELSQAIPPAYTEFLGRQVLDLLSMK
jgi:DNA (cytosine-5)-methyltransferase 1